jgi:hypothetical protein
MWRIDLDPTNELIYHLLYWSGEHTELVNELCKRDKTASIQLFFSMAILNDSEENQRLFN